MNREVPGALRALVGREVTLRFPNAGVTGRLLAAEREPWGYLLQIASKVGEHYVAFPGDVMQLIVAANGAESE